MPPHNGVDSVVLVSVQANAMQVVWEVVTAIVPAVWHIVNRGVLAVQ